MLLLKPNCESCDADLPPEADARICSFECTLCVSCAEVARDACQNCGGELVRRPIRPAALLEKYPASSERVLRKR